MQRRFADGRQGAEPARTLWIFFTSTTRPTACESTPMPWKGSCAISPASAGRMRKSGGSSASFTIWIMKNIPNRALFQDPGSSSGAWVAGRVYPGGRFARLGHMLGSGPQSDLEKVLYTIDELTGLVVTTALIRPSRSVMDVTVKSVKNKWKDKRFAAGVNREVIEKGAQMVGVPLGRVDRRHDQGDAGGRRSDRVERNWGLNS